MTHEKRRHKRFGIDIIELTGKLNLDDHVDIIDISFGGVALSVGKRLNIGQECLFRLRDRRNSIDIRGTVVRSQLCRIRETPDKQRVSVYSAGMRFNEGYADRVATFIRNSVMA